MSRQLAAVGLVCVLCLPACGGGGGTPTQSSTPVPVPSSAITATGSGNIEVHPSALAGFGAALVMPIRIRETGGGTADWTFARYSATLKGVELERKEFTSDSLINAGVSKIAASQDRVYSLTFHVNSTDFDDFSVSLGFSDLKDGRQFTTQVPLSSFSGVVSSLTPAMRPGLVNLDK